MSAKSKNWKLINRGNRVVISKSLKDEPKYKYKAVSAAGTDYYETYRDLQNRKSAKNVKAKSE